MKRSGCSEEHKAKGNFESGEVPTITFLPFYVLCTHTHAQTHRDRDSNTQLFMTRTSSTLAFSGQLTKTDSDITNNRLSHIFARVFTKK